MLFRKRVKRPEDFLFDRPSRPAQRAVPQLYRIDYDMMLKGARIMRGRAEIRQFAVMVEGSTKVVTSGETVERTVYEALIAAGAIRGDDTPSDAPPERQPAAAGD